MIDMVDLADLELKIKKLIDEELNNGMLDRNKLYVKVADQIGVHRVMVRRIARKMVAEYVEKYNVLKNDSSTSFVGYHQF